jgi:hypothetical protein
VKGFRKTGNGPKSGFSFPSKAGFGPSSGKVKNVSGYSRRAPKHVMKKAIGGLVADGVVEAPGFSDYAKGGRVAGVSNPMSAREAMQHAKGGKVSDKKQDRKMISSAIQKHVNAPAPRGHKGLGKILKTGK